ncbi:uncharacterized protein MELLADRAFT_92030 [Melampsora larici-populina 98AG31]|uniref:Uncharacterized protein n=1 Tax=Melampsora larici-populina (strain 98AG31 / pathotype 3-4-7) TaxID=747676 RepID=F4S1A1_MELLP|nr:uncharacterized protein MELLADRAFT_92030 [Melampsora larici-populina 98AG31]EGG01598.1 hypothetical protein MELLADRAFT_92030 [Melampsora larici-populina 98AG31]
MRARGFWNGSHYWCQVVRTVGSLTGVWRHNDLENAGIATLLTTDLKAIGGPLPFTSWVMYSRAPTPKESSIIKTATTKINQSLRQKEVLVRPFSQTVDEEFEELAEDEQARIESEKDKTEGEDEDVAKGEKLTNKNKQKGKRRTICDGENVPLAERKKLSNSNKPNPDCEHADEDVQLAKSIISKKAIKRNRGRPRRIHEKEEEDKLKQQLEDSVHKVGVHLNKEDILRKGAKRAKGWKGWAIVEEEEEEVEVAMVEEEADIDEPHGARKSKRNKRKMA